MPKRRLSANDIEGMNEQYHTSVLAQAHELLRQNYRKKDTTTPSPQMTLGLFYLAETIIAEPWSTTAPATFTFSKPAITTKSYNDNLAILLRFNLARNTWGPRGGIATAIEPKPATRPP